MSIEAIDFSVPWLTTEQMVEVDRLMIEQDSPVLSLDLPSGIDAGSGEVFDPAVRATATLTLALPKNGLRTADGCVGELYLADIGVPPSLYTSPSLALPPVGPLFATGDIVRLK